MNVAHPIDVVSHAGEITNQPAVNIPANTVQPFRFRIKKGQKLSSFYVKREHGGGTQEINGMLTKDLPGAPQTQPPIEFANGRDTSSDNRCLSHSDSGVSGSANLLPDVDYYGSFWTKDGTAVTGLVFAYGNGGV